MTFQPYEVITEPQVLRPLSLCSPRTVELTFSSFNHQSCIHNHSEVITILPFSRVSRAPYLMLPSWELQEGDQSPLLPVGVRPDWGLDPGPYLILWPFLVSWSTPPVSPAGVRPSRESEHQCEREPEHRPVVRLLAHLGVPLFQPRRATSPAAQATDVIAISLGPPEMLQKPEPEKPSTTLGELEDAGLLCWRAQRT